MPEATTLFTKKDSLSPCQTCKSCQCFGYCEIATLPKINDDTLSDPVWLRDARNFASSLAIPGALWSNEIFNLWRDLKVMPPQGFPIETLFLPPDGASGEQIRLFTQALADWCDYFLNGPYIPETVTPYVTKARREHARIVFTLLASHNLDEFTKWGQR